MGALLYSDLPLISKSHINNFKSASTIINIISYHLLMMNLSYNEMYYIQY